jgi:predicted GNAT family N-acyltransferase
MIFLKSIQTQDTFLLRQQILRPQQTPAEMGYLNDDHHDTAHFGAFLNEELIGVVTLLPEDRNGNIQRNIWRLRGMAILPQHQKKGYGKILVTECLKWAKKHNGKSIWCNARTHACDFYAQFGFKKEGSEFLIPYGGPHFVMECELK